MDRALDDAGGRRRVQAAARGLFLVNLSMPGACFGWGLLMPRLASAGRAGERLTARGWTLGLGLLAWIVIRGTEAGADTAQVPHVDNAALAPPVMTGLFIIAHAPLASALREAALHAFPEAAQALAVYDVPASADPDQVLAEATARVRAQQAAETLVLTDVFGATPCNVARQLAEQPGVRVAAGVNVPMLWRALNYRHKPLDELVALALSGAVQGVMPVAVTRPQNQALKPASHDPIDRHHQQ